MRCPLLPTANRDRDITHRTQELESVGPGIGSLVTVSGSTNRVAAPQKGVEARARCDGVTALWPLHSKHNVSRDLHSEQRAR